MRQYVVLLVLAFLVLSLSACSSDPKLSSRITNVVGTPVTTQGPAVVVVKGIETAEINVDGFNQVQNINSEKQAVLRITGGDHQLTVLPGAKITAIFINGQNILVKLPTGLDPHIQKTGRNVTVEYN